MTTTANVGLPLPDFTVTGWDTAIKDAFYLIDAAIKQYTFVVDTATIWKNSISYGVDVFVVDSTTGKYYKCLVNHTSHASNSFATDRTNNPTYWLAQDPETALSDAVTTVTNSFEAAPDIIPEELDATLGTVEKPWDRIHVNSFDVYEEINLLSEAYRWTLRGDDTRLRVNFNGAGNTYFKAADEFFTEKAFFKQYIQLYDGTNSPMRIAYEYSNSAPRINFTLDGALMAQVVGRESDSSFRVRQIAGLDSVNFIVGHNNGDAQATFYTDGTIDFRAADALQIKLSDGLLRPITTNDIDLGSATHEFKNLFLSGKLMLSALPTADPSEAGRVWSDSGTLKVSAG